MIKICLGHEEYQVPLIFTFAWDNCEYWCPYCGCHGGMLGAGEQVSKTPELTKRKEAYTKATEEYLNARCILICSKTEYKGKRIKPSELPKEELERLRKIATSWELKKKIEASKEKSKGEDKEMLIGTLVKGEGAKQ